MTSAWNIADPDADADIKIHADIRGCGSGCGAPIHLYCSQGMHPSDSILKNVKLYVKPNLKMFLIELFWNIARSWFHQFLIRNLCRMLHPVSLTIFWPFAITVMADAGVCIFTQPETGYACQLSAKRQWSFANEASTKRSPKYD